MRRVLSLYDSVRHATVLRVSDRVLVCLIKFAERKCGNMFSARTGPRQTSIRLQIAIGLSRIGSYGNAASVARITALFGKGEGLVSNATSRTIRSLNRLAPMLIKWPSSRKRLKFSNYAGNKFGFVGAIGSVDGTTSPLFKAPAVTPWAFYDRKSRYSLHALVTVNHSYEVIDLVLNFLGPTPDSVVQRSAVWCSITTNARGGY